ncbi:unnamed protein product [Paramecium octaurelia]|uniref:Uncharacterized protein n=1 Tax=Paramecium octaurelia TaxID=43137 RepID=A0A8S1XSU5_PAROT|nr:unnamed protein product [Paramecium octaurelia]
MSEYRTRRNQYKQSTVFQYGYPIPKQCWIEYKHLIEYFETYSPFDLVSQGKQISHSNSISITNQIGITFTIGKKIHSIRFWEQEGVSIRMAKGECQGIPKS